MKYHLEQMYHLSFKRKQARSVKFSYLIVRKEQHAEVEPYIEQILALQKSQNSAVAHDMSSSILEDGVLGPLAAYTGSTAASLLTLHNSNNSNNNCGRVIAQPTKKKGHISFPACSQDGVLTQQYLISFLRKHLPTFQGKFVILFMGNGAHPRKHGDCLKIFPGETLLVNKLG